MGPGGGGHDGAAPKRFRRHAAPLSEAEVAAVQKEPGSHFAAVLLVGMAMRNQASEVERLVGELGVPVHLYPTTNDGWDKATAAHHAARRGFVPLLRYLVLEAGANVELHDLKYGRTPVHCAIGWKHDAAALFLLQEGGADGGARATKDGFTPLHYCASYGRSEVPHRVICWVTSQVDPSYRLSQFTHCVPTNIIYTQVARVLLREKGADAEEETEKGEPALQLAKQKGYKAMVALLEYHQRAMAVRRRTEARRAAAAATGQQAGERARVVDDAEADAEAARVAALLLEEEERAAAAARAKAEARARKREKKKGEGKGGGDGDKAEPEPQEPLEQPVPAATAGAREEKKGVEQEDKEDEDGGDDDDDDEEDEATKAADGSSPAQKGRRRRPRPKHKQQLQQPPPSPPSLLAGSSPSICTSSSASSSASSSFALSPLSPPGTGAAAPTLPSTLELSPPPPPPQLHLQGGAEEEKEPTPLSPAPASHPTWRRPRCPRRRRPSKTRGQRGRDRERRSSPSTCAPSRWRCYATRCCWSTTRTRTSGVIWMRGSSFCGSGGSRCGAPRRARSLRGGRSGWPTPWPARVWRSGRRGRGVVGGGDGNGSVV